MSIHSIHTIGDATSVAQRFGSENGFTRPQSLEDVTCINTSGGTLYMQVFDITNTLVPFGTTYSGAGLYTLTGLTIGHTYKFQKGGNDTSTTVGASVNTTLTTAFSQATSTSAPVSTLVVASAANVAIGQQATGTGIPVSVFVTAISGLNISVTPFYPSANSDGGTYSFGKLNTDGTFVAIATSVILTGTISAIITANVTDLTAPQATPVPAEGATPKFSFPVQAGLGGTLGRECYMSGIYCCWSSTQATKTIAAASGEINILVRD